MKIFDYGIYFQYKHSIFILKLRIMSEERKYYTNELTENYSLSIICLKCQLVYPSVSNVGLGGADSVSPNLAVKKKKKKKYFATSWHNWQTIFKKFLHLSMCSHAIG